MQRTLAISFLTLKAAFRYRLILMLSGVLLAGVIILPLIIKDDGTARGFTQIVLTYTLSLITAILGFATLWLSCGILAREIEEAQIQMVVTKPVARWQIWIGKWLGILAVNALLLAVSGAAVFFLLQWRAGHLPAKEQTILHNEVLVARGAAREPIPDYQGDANRILAEKLSKEAPPQGVDPQVLKRYVTERVKAEYQLVQPGYVREWTIDIGDANKLKDASLFIHTKFNSASYSSDSFLTLWELGAPDAGKLYRTNLSLAADSASEFQIPANLFDKDGVIHIRFYNENKSALLFPLEDGMEVLYREGGFGMNFARGLGIIFCWLSVLAALGLAAATFLSFPVAAFCTLGVLIVVFSTGTLKQIVEEGGVTGVNHETGFTDAPTIIDNAAVPMARGLLWLFNLARGFSPIDYLSSGRSISWGEFVQAFLQITVILGGFLALIGIAIFNRRELATAQGAH
jgi:hypothetical protein